MTLYTQETLIPSTTYGTPSGNYDGSSQDWYGNAVIAANYYGGYRSAQTIITDLFSFSGKITIQGTLNSTQFEAQWFDIVTYNYIDAPDITEILTENSIGNFVWLRTRVQGFTTGTINSIKVSY